MKFSERKGFTQVRKVVLTDSVSDPLRNSLWNVLWQYWFSAPAFLNWQKDKKPWVYAFAEYLYANVYKLPIDRLSRQTPEVIFEEIRSRFLSCEWFSVYDFIELTFNYLQRENELQDAINEVLERELAGYRLISGKIVDVTDQQEINALEEALGDDTFSGVQSHLQTALEHLSRRDNPDYRNSIKESISAVEAMVRIVSNNPKAKLSDALRSLDASKKLHPSLKEGFVKLYGYTSDEGGIRHAMLEEPDITAVDAKYMLLSCTSFINYLKALV